MVNAFEMYEGVLLELDQAKAPAFDVQEFNYFVQAAVEKVLLNDLREFELTQTVTDKLSPLIKVTEPALSYNPDNTTDVRKVNVPGDYRHVVSCRVRLRYKAGTVSNTINSIREEYTRRFTGDSQAFITSNGYLCPIVTDADIRLYHRTSGNKLEILFDRPGYPNSTVIIQDVVLEYVAKPPRISLDEDYAIVIDTPFPEHVNQEIVKVTAQLFLENNESPRLQTFAATNN